MSIKAVVFVAILGFINVDVEGHHVKCSDNLLPYCTCPDGTVLTDISTVINPNCVPSTYTCVDGSTCQRNLCCGSHAETVIITCPDGSTFPPVQVGRGKK